MSHILVKFVDDGIYHVCPKVHVRTDTDEVGLVSAKYKGSFFRAAFISEGGKSDMEILKERCITSDNLTRRFKSKSPSTPPSTQTKHQTKDKRDVRKNLFTSATITGPDTAISGPDTAITDPDTATTGLDAAITGPDTAITGLDGKITGPNYYTPEATSTLITEYQTPPTLDITDQPSSVTSPSSAPKYSVPMHQQQAPLEEATSAEMHIETSEAAIAGKKEKKKYYCPYCRNLYGKFARHLFQVHSNEPEILEIIDLKPKDPERTRVIAYIRGRGTLLFNKLQTSPDKIIMSRTKLAFNEDDYMDCYLCGNKYKSRFLHRHIKRCPVGDGSSGTAKRKAMKAAFAVEEEASEAIQFNRDVLSGIRAETLRKEISEDDVLKEYGKHLCSLYAKDLHLINLIRRKLREAAEVLMEMKQNDNNILCMKDVFQPRTKQVFFSAVKKITGYEKGVFKRPAMAKNLMAIFSQCAKRLIGKAIELVEETTRVNAKRWLEIISADYNAVIAKIAIRNLDEKKWNKPRTLPLTAYIFKLNKHIEVMANDAIKSLAQGFSLLQWTNLIKATIVKLVVFNRKRVGDVQRITIDDFQQIHNIQKDSATYEVLSESEKIISTKYMRMESRGKHAKVVPILMTKTVVQQLKVIISNRSKANVDDTNPFVFGKKANLTFSASAILKELAYEVQAANPELLTGTKLRKQIATVSQAFNFTENDLSILAGFLGHNIQTHRDFYRLPDEATQLAKISKVLEAIDNGKVNELKGKSLDELDGYVTRMIEEEDQSTVVEEQYGDTAPSRTDKDSPKKRKKAGPSVIRRTWTTPEKTIMKSRFNHHLINHTLPTPFECNEARIGNSPLKGRTVNQIKAWVYNQNVREQKKHKTN